MNISRALTVFKRLSLAGILAVSAVSCDPASQATLAWIRGTGIVAGTITGFGSIYVNGVEYDIDSAEFDIDGETNFASATEAQQNLAIGMVVRLEATDNGDGTGTAIRVVYDDSIEGPIDAPPALVNGNEDRLSFSILGQEVIVDATETVFDDMAFADLAAGLVVEVSGFIDADGVIHATRVEKTGDAGGEIKVELHGQISGFSAGSFMLGSTQVTYDDQTELKDVPDSGLDNGLRVEVKGLLQAGVLQASKIEVEDGDDYADEELLSLEGVVAGFDGNSFFTLNGVDVDASGMDQSLLDRLSNGVKVEVKGFIENGVLVADEIKLKKAEAKLKAVIASVQGNRIIIHFGNGTDSLEALFDSHSKLKDERSGDNHVPLLAPAQLPVGGAVSLSLRRNGNDWVVDTLKLKDDLGKFEVEGVVEAIDDQAPTVTLLGLTLQLASAPQPNWVGQKVELKDENMDGIFEQAELEEEDDD